MGRNGDLAVGLGKLGFHAFVPCPGRLFHGPAGIQALARRFPGILVVSFGDFFVGGRGAAGVGCRIIAPGPYLAIIAHQVVFGCPDIAESGGYLLLLDWVKIVVVFLDQCVKFFTGPGYRLGAIIGKFFHSCTGGKQGRAKY